MTNKTKEVLNEAQVLVEELNPTECNLIEEATTDGKNVWLSGVYMQAGIKNRNGRNYPVTEIAKAVQEAADAIKESHGIFGELDHPNTLTINLDRVSHAITNLRMEGNNAVGKAKILNTPCGQIARGLIESGVRLGVSSRGAGNVGGNGDVSNFKFVTVDIVATPSAPGATPNTIYESINYGNGDKVMTLAESLCHDEAAQKYFKKEIHKFVEKLVSEGLLTIKKK